MNPRIPPTPPSDGEDNNHGDERYDNNTNINPPPEQEIGQGPAGVTRPKTGVHYQDVGVHQN